MTLITSLPEELLSNIFNKLNDLNSLARCRLVCKAWSDPAERAMLGNTVTISSNAAKTRSLYAVLKKNPEKAYLIKHLCICDFERFPQDCILDLLQLALAPNVESITGFVWEEGFFDTLTDIVERSPNKLDRLKTLTLVSVFSKPPLRLLLHCKSTIQTIQLRFTTTSSGIDWNFVDRLNEFVNLTSLELRATVDTITDLDRILSQCPQLQKLSLKISGLERSRDWDQQRIERNTNLKVLSIPEGFCPIEMLSIPDGFCPSEMLEYLLYKYPNIKSAFIDVLILGGFDEEYISQVPRLLQRVSQRKLIYGVPESTDISVILRCLKNDGYKITVEEADFLNTVRIKVDC